MKTKLLSTKYISASQQGNEIMLIVLLILVIFKISPHLNEAKLEIFSSDKREDVLRVTIIFYSGFFIIQKLS